MEAGPHCSRLTGQHHLHQYLKVLKVGIVRLSHKAGHSGVLRQGVFPGKLDGHRGEKAPDRVLQATDCDGPYM